MPAGSLANASSVGANTVNGPLPFKRVDEAGGLERSREGLERTRRHGGVDDVLRLRLHARLRRERDEHGDGRQGDDGTLESKQRFHVAPL